jgi:hypothetical protein
MGRSVFIEPNIMKAIRDANTKTGFVFACLWSCLFFLVIPPANGEELKPEQIIARCQSKLTTQEAVLLPVFSTDQFIVIAARDKKLDGEVVQLKHIIGKEVGERRFIYCKEKSDTPLLTLPYLHNELSIDETFALKRYYAAQGKITIMLTSHRSTKAFHPKAAKKAIRK